MYNLHVRITKEQNKQLIKDAKKAKVSKAEMLRIILGEIFEPKKLSTGTK